MKKGKLVGIILLVLLAGAFVYRFTHLSGTGGEHAEHGEHKEHGKKDEHAGEKEAHPEKDEHGDEPHSVTLDEEAQKKAGVVIASAKKESLPAVVTATGKVEVNADRIAHVSPRIPGKVISASANLGDGVGAGQTLARLESVELTEAVNKYRQSSGRVALAQKNMDRVKALVEKKIAARKEIFQAESDFQSAESEMQADRERLQFFGVSPDAALKSGGRLILPVTSPISGIVTEKHVMVGELADPSKNLFTVADLSSVWVLVDINEKDLAKVRPGQTATVTVGAFPDQKYRGRITHIADVVDEATRTVKARVEVANPGRKLKPEMFATVELTFPATGTPVLAVSADAVQEVEGKKVVFVTEDGKEFMVREIAIGTQGAGKVEIAEGLKEGERYAAKGSFILKSEMMKGELGEHGH